MDTSSYCCFDETDEHLHQPGAEPAWNESMAFAVVEANGPTLFLRHGRRYNEGHIEVTLAQMNPDGSLDVAFAKRPLTVADIGNGKQSSGGGMIFSQIEAGKRWTASYEGTVRRIADFRDFAADPRAALDAATRTSCRFDIAFEDRGPLFGTGPNGSIPGGEKYLSGRHYESTIYCSGDITVDGVSRKIDTYGFRDHSWGVRDMTQAEFTRWFWVQLDAESSCVGWFTRAEGKDHGSGIIVRKGEFEVATSAKLVSSYGPAPDYYAKSAKLKLGSPNGDIVVEIETVGALPLRYQKDGRIVRGLEFASRIKGTNWPAWAEYWDQMVDGVPQGNQRA